MRFVLPKGRLLHPSMELLSSSGISLPFPEGRSLFSRVNGNEVLFAKPADVPTYVERMGDMGISATDVTEEEGSSDIFIPLGLDFGICRMSVAVPRGSPIDPSSMDGLSVATRYPVVARKFFSSIGIGVTIVKLSGSIELAPSMGIADAIMDIVETGGTLEANGLVEAFKVMDIQAQVIVNRISLKTKYQEINAILRSFGRVMENGY